MPWYIIMITLAWVFYTWAVWGSRVDRELCWFFVWLFMVGFLCDIIGTAPMMMRANGFGLSLHAIIGISSLLIMALHGVWAYLALRSPPTNQLFHRCSPWAYGLWMLAFITGGILHFMGR